MTAIMRLEDAVPGDGACPQAQAGPFSRPADLGAQRMGGRTFTMAGRWFTISERGAGGRPPGLGSITTHFHCMDVG